MCTFTLIDGFELIDRRPIGDRPPSGSHFDPSAGSSLPGGWSAYLKKMLKIRSELAFGPRLYLEPILIGVELLEHLIELLSLI